MALKGEVDELKGKVLAAMKDFEAVEESIESCLKNNASILKVRLTNFCFKLFRIIPKHLSMPNFNKKLAKLPVRVNSCKPAAVDLWETLPSSTKPRGSIITARPSSTKR